MTSGIRRGDGPPQIPTRLETERATEVKAPVEVAKPAAPTDVIGPNAQAPEATPAKLSTQIDDKGERANGDLNSILDLKRSGLFGDEPGVEPLKGVGLTMPADIADVEIDVDSLLADSKDPTCARDNPDYSKALVNLIKSGALDALRKQGD